MAAVPMRVGVLRSDVGCEGACPEARGLRLLTGFDGVGFASRAVTPMQTVLTDSPASMQKASAGRQRRRWRDRRWRGRRWWLSTVAHPMVALQMVAQWMAACGRTKLL